MSESASIASGAEPTLGLRPDASDLVEEVVSDEIRDDQKFNSVRSFDRYSRREGRLHLHTGMAGGIMNGRKVCAIFDPTGLDVFHGDAWTGDLELNKLPESMRQDCTVFVPVVEILDVGKGPRFMPYVVRLHLLDKCLCVKRQLAHLGPAGSSGRVRSERPDTVLAEEVLGGIANGEGDAGIVGFNPVANGQ